MKREERESLSSQRWWFAVCRGGKAGHMSIQAAEGSNVDEGRQFAGRLANASPADAKKQIEEKLMSLDSVRQVEWLSQVLRWLVSQTDARPAPAATPLMRGVPQPAAKRIEAITWTYQAAPQHAEFRHLVEKADGSRDQHQYAQAELQYWQALRIFPLHGGYRVQYAHCLKEQQKYSDAFIQYWYALGLGAPQQDVEEHVLFAARHASIAARASDVGRRAAAFASAQRWIDDWEAAPIDKDFKDFAELFWGDHAPLTSAFVIEQLLACHTRKALFIKYIGAPETIRRNRPLFVMLNQKGLPDV